MRCSIICDTSHYFVLRLVQTQKISPKSSSETSKKKKYKVLKSICIFLWCFHSHQLYSFALVFNYSFCVLFLLYFLNIVLNWFSDCYFYQMRFAKKCVLRIKVQINNFNYESRFSCIRCPIFFYLCSHKFTSDFLRKFSPSHFSPSLSLFISSDFQPFFCLCPINYESKYREGMFLSSFARLQLFSHSFRK